MAHPVLCWSLAEARAKLAAAEFLERVPGT